MTTIQQLQEEGAREFEKNFIATKICKCCMKKDCDYSTTGCPWYEDSYIVDNRTRESAPTSEAIKSFLSNQQRITWNAAINEALEVTNNHLMNLARTNDLRGMPIVLRHCTEEEKWSVRGLLLVVSGLTSLLSDPNHIEK